jgi:ParB family chromosome partitioning protein
MTTVTTVPFASLVAVDAINARAATKDGIDELAQSILTKGLIQPLAVRPADGGKWEVIDGRRRHQAIARLVKTKRWAKDAEVPVLIRNEDDGDALETSLIANTVRLPMHPVDQYEVFTRLAAQGRSDAEIAARFAITDRTVRQQRALGALAPAVRKAWREGRIEAKAAQAFCCNPDHAAQEAAWAKLKVQTKSYGGLSDYDVRRELTGEQVDVASVDDAVLARYTAAGGTIAKDLFEDASYVEDRVLLQRCKDEVKAERLAPVRARLAGQGWAWVADADELPAGWRYQWQRLKGGRLTRAEEARHDELIDRIDAAEQDPAGRQRLFDEVLALLEAAALRDFTPELRARAGVVIDDNHYDDGDIDVHYGVLRPATDGQTDLEDGEDEEPAEATADEDTADEDDAPDAPFRISGALLETITTAQTKAVATLVAQNGELAHRLAVAALRTTSYSSPVMLGIDNGALERPATASGFARHLTDALGASYGEIIQQFAGLVAAALSLVEGHYFGDDARDGKRALVAALDGGEYLYWMREAFLAEDYFKRATKETALAALAEMQEAGAAAGLAPEDVLAGMKKADLATVAASAAKACGWLPPELRHPTYTLAALADAAPATKPARTKKSKESAA